MNRGTSAASLAVVLALAIVAAPARATTVAAERELTLDDALALAKKRNKSLVAERARVAQAQTNLSSAWARLLPTIAAQGKYTRNYADRSLSRVPSSRTRQVSRSWTPGRCMRTTPLLIQPINQLDGAISFNAPLIVPAAYPGLKAVKSNIAAAEANFELSETDLLFAVAQAFYAAGIADEVLIARRSSIDVTRATLKNAQTRLSAGTVTKVDVDRAELALLRAEQMERDARHGREQAYRGLATLIQIEGPFRVVSRPSRTAPADRPGHRAQLRPEFRALELSAHAAEQQRDRRVALVAADLGVRKRAQVQLRQLRARPRPGWSACSSTGSSTTAARAMRSATSPTRRKRRADAPRWLRDNIRDDLAQRAQPGRDQAAGGQAASRAVVLARETIDLVRTQYEAGTVTQVDLLQAQDGLVGAQEALAQSRFDLAVADLTLRRTAGTFRPAEQGLDFQGEELVAWGRGRT